MDCILLPFSSLNTHFALQHKSAFTHTHTDTLVVDATMQGATYSSLAITMKTLI